MCANQFVQLLMDAVGILLMRIARFALYLLSLYLYIDLIFLFVCLFKFLFHSDKYTEFHVRNISFSFGLCVCAQYHCEIRLMACD